jgi:hypothetical protein
MLSAIYSDILFDILSRIRSGILTVFLLWHPIYLFWQSIWHIFLALNLANLLFLKFDVLFGIVFGSGGV